MRKIAILVILSLTLLLFLGCVQPQDETGAQELGAETDTTLDEIDSDLSELEELVESEANLGDSGIDDAFFE